MKKIILSIICLNILILNSYSLELEDCSKFSKFSSDFYICKKNNFVKDSKEYQKKEWSEGKKRLENAKEGVIKTKEDVIKTKDKILNR